MQGSELEHADAELAESIGREPEHAQRFEDLLHVVTAGDDPEPCVGRVGNELVERVGRDIPLGPFDAVAEDLDLQGVGKGHADVCR